MKRLSILLMLFCLFLPNLLLGLEEKYQITDIVITGYSGQDSLVLFYCNLNKGDLLTKAQITQRLLETRQKLLFSKYFSLVDTDVDYLPDKAVVKIDVSQRFPYVFSGSDQSFTFGLKNFAARNEDYYFTFGNTIQAQYNKKVLWQRTDFFRVTLGQSNSENEVFAHKRDGYLDFSYGLESGFMTYQAGFGYKQTFLDPPRHEYSFVYQYMNVGYQNIDDFAFPNTGFEANLNFKLQASGWNQLDFYAAVYVPVLKNLTLANRIDWGRLSENAPEGEKYIHSTETGYYAYSLKNQLRYKCPYSSFLFFSGSPVLFGFTEWRQASAEYGLGVEYYMPSYDLALQFCYIYSDQTVNFSANKLF